jgi:hypothetical protein
MKKQKDNQRKHILKYMFLWFFSDVNSSNFFLPMISGGHIVTALPEEDMVRVLGPLILFLVLHRACRVSIFTYYYYIFIFETVV